MDDEEFVPLMDFIPINVSDQFAECRAQCKTKRERDIWDMAIKECIKSVVLESPPDIDEQIYDLKWLMFEEWDWQADLEFVGEAKRKKKQHVGCFDEPVLIPVQKPMPKLSDHAREQIKKADQVRDSMWAKIRNKVLG